MKKQLTLFGNPIEPGPLGDGMVLSVYQDCWDKQIAELSIASRKRHEASVYGTARTRQGAVAALGKRLEKLALFVANQKKGTLHAAKAK